MKHAVHTKVLDGGWLLLSIKTGDDTESFHKILQQLKYRLHVLVYDNALRKYKTSVYELQNLSNYCDSRNIDLIVTDKVMRLYNRMLIKNKRIKKIRKNGCKELQINGWTKDESYQLFPYQKKCVKLVTEAKRFLIGDDMGVGKTPQAIGSMLKSWEEYDFADGLIVCPERLCYQWKEEIHTFTQLRPNQVEVLGNRACRTGARSHFIKTCHECRNCKFYESCSFDKETANKSAAHYRALQIKRAKVLVCGYTALRINEKDFKGRQFEVTIFDEATRLKNRTAGVSKAAANIIDEMPISHVVIPMSGTFIENRLDELYNIMSLVDPKILGGWGNFKNHYLVVDHWGNVVGYRNENVLKNKLDNILIRRTVDEVWKDRPPVTERIVDCPMTKQQEELYAAAREGIIKDQIPDLKKAQKINMYSMAPLLNQLIMLATTMKSADENVQIDTHSGKFLVLKEMLEEEFPKDAKVVVFSKFSNKVIPHLVQDLNKWGIGYVDFTKIKPKRQKEAIKDFKKSKKKRVMIVSDAMAYGANFQFANYMVNIDLPWKPATLDQRYRRIYRRGQKKPVTIVNLMVPDTVEQHVYQILQVKKKLFGTFFKDTRIFEEKIKNMTEQDWINLL